MVSPPLMTRTGVVDTKKLMLTSAWLHTTFVGHVAQMFLQGASGAHDVGINVKPAPLQPVRRSRPSCPPAAHCAADSNLPGTSVPPPSRLCSAPGQWATRRAAMQQSACSKDERPRSPAPRPPSSMCKRCSPPCGIAESHPRARGLITSVLVRVVFIASPHAHGHDDLLSPRHFSLDGQVNKAKLLLSTPWLCDFMRWDGCSFRRTTGEHGTTPASWEAPGKASRQRIAAKSVWYTSQPACHPG